MQVAPIAVVPRWRTLPLALAGVAAISAAAAIAATSTGSPAVAARDAIAQPQVAPGACEDPAVGLWRAHEFRPGHDDWIEHQIHIVKERDGGYGMEHIARVRDGDRNGPTRFSCMPDAFEFHTVGRAELDRGFLHVWGEKLVTKRARCDGATLSYDLDSFTGVLDGDTFDSVNNDGATAVDRPYYFRRIACE